MAGVVLCSTSASKSEMIWVVCSNCGSKHIQISRRMVAAYGLYIRIEVSERLRACNMERYSAMKCAGVSGPIVV